MYKNFKWTHFAVIALVLLCIPTYNLMSNLGDKIGDNTTDIDLELSQKTAKLKLTKSGKDAIESINRKGKQDISSSSLKTIEVPKGKFAEWHDSNDAIFYRQEWISIIGTRTVTFNFKEWTFFREGNKYPGMILMLSEGSMNRKFTDDAVELTLTNKGLHLYNQLVQQNKS